MSEPKPGMPAKLGRYQIVGELGKGAMGIVFEGLDPEIQRRVAIKTARRDVMEASGRASEMMERFLREARAAGRLNHPNIITIYDAGEENGTAWIAMEYLEGRDLQHTLTQKGRFSTEEAVQLCATVCEALAHAHKHGIVHRDIKPSNIIVQPDGSIRVADFGIARTSDSSLTQDGALIGTPHYMSPEQFMGHKADGRSDLFSVGIIVYEMITGEKPFPGEALGTVMHSVMKTTPIHPRELNFSVNPVLDRVVMKALSKDPNQRYATGIELAAALRECLKPIPDPAITKVEAPPKGDDLDATAPGGLGKVDKTVVLGHEAAAPAQPPQERSLATADTVTSAGPAVAIPKAPATLAGGAVAPEAPAKAGFPKGILLGAAGLVAVLAALGAFLMGGGGYAYDVAPTENHFDRIQLEVYLAKSSEQYAALTESYADTELKNLVEGAPKAFIDYPDGHTQELGVLEKPNLAKSYPLEGRPAEFVIRLELDGYLPVEQSVRGPLEPGQLYERARGLDETPPILMCPADK